MNILRRYLTVGLVLFAMLTVPAGTVLAAAYGGIGARPAYPQPNNPRSQSIFIFELKPGQQASNGVQIINNTNQSQTVNLYAVDSAVASGGNFTCAQNGAPKKDVGAWISLADSSVTVPANSNQIVPFTITVPDSGSIAVGEHDGCIAMQAVSQTAVPSDKNGVLLSFRTAIRVAVTIPGKIIKKLHIVSVTVSKGHQSNYIITPLVSNDGNVSLDTAITTSLSSVFGPTLMTTKRGSNPVLPHTQSSWNYTVNKPFWGGWYRADVTVSYDANTATGLGITTNSQTKTETMSSALFFVAPAPLALVIEIVVLLLIIAIVFLGIHRLIDGRAVKQQWKPVKIGQHATLQTLAQDYGVSWHKIAKVNKLKPPYHLEAGQKLKLPIKRG